ncbi:zinc-dependent alcohol dehydrogenase [Actinomadura rugatobispora]|uniref:Zinc-binding dehydrogenase n=1 Tax=Actinomadura rugatobispora TaxID=1994 RepID=A0ABW1A7X9_9ACTN|nr:2,3-butanediol dehydrogenase [Actinomadura rugatobispora]
MRAAFISAAGAIRIEEVADPAPDRGGVVVDIVSCSICATDAHYFAAGGHDVPPSIFGHEWVGRVSEVGADVTDLDAGRLVAVTVGTSCGTCAPCRRNLGDLCASTLQQARGRDSAASPWGGFSDRIAVTASRVLPLPESMPAESRELVEPAAVAHRGVRRAGIRLDDLVVVQGGGAIGQFAAQWARLAGAGRVVVVEPSAPRRELAVALGADEAVRPDEAADRVSELSEGLGADVSIECTGIASLVYTGSEFLRRGGRLALLGFPLEPSTIPVREWLIRELEVVASMGYSRSDTATTVRFAADGRLRAAGMVTMRIGFDGLESTLAGMHARTIDEPRVVFDPGAH